MEPDGMVEVGIGAGGEVVDTVELYRALETVTSNEFMAK
jgi:hypothetical protein